MALPPGQAPADSDCDLVEVSTSTVASKAAALSLPISAV
jgi:hypothetical protein